jgi:hypothetical protein
MANTLKWFVIGVVLLILVASLFGEETEEFTLLPGFGKKCRIGEDYTFVYDFDKTPKMGTSILRIKLFDGKGDKATDLEILGRSDMPSMSGAHDSGDVPFKLNKKGVYLLPVNIVMPGEWEIRLIFLKDKSVIHRARFLFNV